MYTNNNNVSTDRDGLFLVLVFCPLLTNKTHPAGGIASVVAHGSSSRSGGSPWAAPTLAANSSECGQGLAGGYAVYLECLVWSWPSQAPEPLAVSHH